MIIELLMMNLHVHDIYKWVVCELYSIDELWHVVVDLWWNSWLWVVVVVVNVISWIEYELSGDEVVVL